MAEIGRDIEKAKYWLEKEEVVAIPTETVYGLAGNALNPLAVSKIFEVKNRPSFNPLIVHIGKIEQIYSYTNTKDPRVEKLASKFWPGPLTILLPKSDLIPELVTAGNERAAIRIPDHPLTLKLLNKLDFPLAAPSANPFGYISPTQAAHVNNQLGSKIPYILDGGPCQVGLESTIIGLEKDGSFQLYRSGGMPIEEIEEITDSLKPASPNTPQPQSSGQLKSHYAPSKSLFLGDLANLWSQLGGSKTAVLAFQDKPDSVPEDQFFALSKKGDLQEAASHLFELLHQLDQSHFDLILAEKVPNIGLGRAINDRLERAQAKHK
jgi:L-threonylcarbamoyladenylate synthase